MGRRTNPNVFRLGKKLEWKYKYIEKKSEEFSIYNFKTLELKSAIKTFLKKNGLMLQNYKINFYKSTVKIYIPYYLLLKPNTKINEKKSKIKLKKSRIKLKTNAKIKNNQKLH
jgi:hypothetical protein